MCPFSPENSSKMTRGSHQMAGLIVLYSIKMRVSLECGSLSRASLFGGFTVIVGKFMLVGEEFFYCKGKVLFFWDKYLPLEWYIFNQ